MRMIRIEESKLEQIYDLLIHINIQPPNEINRAELRLQIERLKAVLYGFSDTKSYNNA